MSSRRSAAERLSRFFYVMSFEIVFISEELSTYAASVRLQSLFMNVVRREQRVRPHRQEQLRFAFNLILI